MSPRTRLLGACRALAVCARPVAQHSRESFRPATSVFRSYSTDANGHPTISGDAARNENISSTLKVNASATNFGKQATPPTPQTSQGPDNLHIDTLSDAALEQILYGGRPATSETEGGLTAAQEEALYREGTIPTPAEAEAEALIARSQASEPAQLPIGQGGDIQNPGHKFGLPRKPYPEGFNLKQRYHPVLEQLTRLLMRDGKLSGSAWRRITHSSSLQNVATVMNFLRTAPAPIYSPKFPLLPGTPMASHLPLNPVLYITIAIDSVAPLLKVRNIAGAGGGGRALELPVPLAVRQRRRMAVKWILDVIEKKPSKGSGKNQFPHRIAEEIIAVVEGRSSVWEKRKQVHKLGTAARANVSSKKLKVKKKM
ncbi:30S ribosomal protein S7, partial [Metarhizium hybridum]